MKNSMMLQFLIMKYKKQLRWLAFILCPFIAILSLHVITPLQITSNCLHLFTEVFGFTSAGLHFRNSARSMHLQNSKIIRSLYQELATQLNFFGAISKGNTNKSNGAIDHNNSLLNAFTIKQNSSFIENMKSKTKESSIWFDIDNKYNNLQDLPNELQIYLDSYLSIQPYIKSYFKLNQLDLIESIGVFYKSQTDSIYFQYPFQTKNPFKHINATSLDTKYDSILSVSKNQPNSSFLVPFVQFNPNDLTYMSLCILVTSSLFKSIICLNVDVDSFGLLMWQRLGLLESQVLTTNGYLSLQGIQTNSKTLNIVFQFNKQRFNKAQMVNDSFQIGNQNLKQLVSTSLQFNTRFQSQADIYISKIKCIPVPNNLQAPTFVTHVIRTATVSKYSSASGTLDSIIIVTIILAVIEIIIIGIVLKRLLESVDRDLGQLGNMTHHIIRGDINIEIPSYDGTKDIGQVYEVVKKINKLHRYSTQTYFTGHFSQKILKYVQALQFIKSLNYDLGNLYQNLGEAYTYIEQWELSLKYLKKCVDNIMEYISSKFQPFQMIYKRKLNRQALPSRYRETQLILIRRLFKLVYLYIRYLQLGPIHLKKLDIDDSNDQAIKKKLQQLNIEFLENIVLIKKAFYPNFQKFSEVLITLSFQCKNKFSNKKIQQGKAVFKKLEEIYAMYKQTHPTVIKMLKQKGSKNKYLYSCNKMTFQSRFHPDLIVALLTSTKAKFITVSEKQPKKYIQIFDLYSKAFQTSLVTMNTWYMLGLQVRKSIIQLKIDPQPYETTQIFKQLIPYRTLCDSKITKQNEALLLRKAGTQCIGLQREYVFVLDCERQIINSQNIQEFYEQRMNHMYTKLIKLHDRISIIKFNTKQGIKVECNLLLKKDNQPLLTKSLKESILQRNKETRVKINLFDVIFRTIQRIKNLQKEKVIVFFFRSLKHYKAIAYRSSKKRSIYYEKRKSQSIIAENEVNQNHKNYVFFQQFGQCLVQILRTPGLRNTKLILFSAKDSNQDFIDFFGLNDINRRIWAQNNGLNKHNNTVYIIQDKHRSDIDRILMPKVTDVPDNNVFIL